MSDSARVISIQTLRDFRAAILNFIEEAAQALRATEMQIHHTEHWLGDQLTYWRGQVKYWEEEVEQAKANLHRARVSQSYHGPPKIAEEKDAVREAQRRVEAAEDRIEEIRRWEPKVQEAVAEYMSQGQPLADRLEGDLQQAIAKLERMIDALDAYVHLAAPAGRSHSPVAASAATPTTAPTTSAAPASAPAAAAPAPPAESGDAQGPAPEATPVAGAAADEPAQPPGQG